MVETPRGAAVKLSYEPKARVFEYSQPLPVGHTYAYDWGFIPSTLGDDGDPLDGLVIHEATTAPGVVVKYYLLGAVHIKQKDAGGAKLRNNRCIYRPHKEDAPDEPLSSRAVPRELQIEIEQFFLSSVIDMDKKIKLKGWQPWMRPLPTWRRVCQPFAGSHARVDDAS